ncbi:MAG: N-acetylmuramoyl-L-alanine amidase [Candidatus Eisenbacteria bacterium]
MRRAAVLVALIVLVGAAPAPAPAPLDPPQVPVPAAVGVLSAKVVAIEGLDMLSAQDLARLLDASRFWRADVRKMVLRARSVRITLTVDTPIAIVDDRTVRLAGSVRSRNGELFVPISLLPALARDSSLARLVFDPVARAVRVAPPDGFVGSPRVQVVAGITRLTFPAERAAAVEVAGRSRARFRLRVPGAFAGNLPDSLPGEGLVRDLHVLPAAGSVLFELALAPQTGGFRLLREEGRVSLEFSGGVLPGLERFAAEAPAGPRTIRVIVLDAGHGGTDRGSTAGTAIEKDLTLQLARLLAPELERRTGAVVVLTRSDDRAISQEHRAEAANRARADLVVSLHFDSYPNARARGVTVYCPPADAPDASTSGYTPVSLTPWRDVALRYAVSSRSLAESIVGALEQSGFGPVRVRERLPVPLLGVNAPGVLLECATLTSSDDVSRLMRPAGLRRLAAAIAEGIVAYQLDE